MLLWGLIFYFLHSKKNSFKLNILNLLLFYFYFVKKSFLYSLIIFLTILNIKNIYLLMHSKLKLSIFFKFIIILFIFEMVLDREIKNKRMLDREIKTKGC